MEQPRHLPKSGEERKKPDGAAARGYSFYYLPLGVAVGISLGAATDNMSLWLSIGLCMGLLFSVTFGKKNGRKPNGDQKSE